MLSTLPEPTPEEDTFLGHVRFQANQFHKRASAYIGGTYDFTFQNDTPWTVKMYVAPEPKPHEQVRDGHILTLPAMTQGVKHVMTSGMIVVRAGFYHGGSQEVYEIFWEDRRFVWEAGMQVCVRQKHSVDANKFHVDVHPGAQQVHLSGLRPYVQQCQAGGETLLPEHACCGAGLPNPRALEDYRPRQLDIYSARCTDFGSCDYQHAQAIGIVGRQQASGKGQYDLEGSTRVSGLEDGVTHQLPPYATAWHQKQQQQLPPQLQQQQHLLQDEYHPCPLSQSELLAWQLEENQNNPALQTLLPETGPFTGDTIGANYHPMFHVPDPVPGEVNSQGSSTWDMIARGYNELGAVHSEASRGPYSAGSAARVDASSGPRSEGSAVHSDAGRGPRSEGNAVHSDAGRGVETAQQREEAKKFVMQDAAQQFHRYLAWAFPDVDPRYVQQAVVAFLNDGTEHAWEVLRKLAGEQDVELKPTCSEEVDAFRERTRCLYFAQGVDEETLTEIVHAYVDGGVKAAQQKLVEYNKSFDWQVPKQDPAQHIFKPLDSQKNVMQAWPFPARPFGVAPTQEEAQYFERYIAVDFPELPDKYLHMVRHVFKVGGGFHHAHEILLEAAAQEARERAEQQQAEQVVHTSSANRDVMLGAGSSCSSAAGAQLINHSAVSSQGASGIAYVRTAPPVYGLQSPQLLSSTSQHYVVQSVPAYAQHTGQVLQQTAHVLSPQPVVHSGPTYTQTAPVIAQRFSPQPIALRSV